MPESLSLRGPDVPHGATGSFQFDHLLEAFLAQSADRDDGFPPTLRDWVDRAESWRIIYSLQRCRGNRSAAARELGIGRRTLYTKMEKLGISPTFGATSLPSGSERR